MDRPSTAAVIVAAGRGTRLGGEPKQWRPLRGARICDRSVAAFADHPAVDEVVVVLHPEDRDRIEGVRSTLGGATRGASVQAGLEAVEAERVLIHDAARPLVSRAVIDRVLAALDTADGAAPALPVTDALWVGTGTVEGTRDREGLWRAQTPQGFRTAAILAAHRAHPGGAADDVEVARAAGMTVAIVEGCEDNVKITRPGDMERAERIAGGAMEVRTGNGFDVHRLGPGSGVALCGVVVPHDGALVGHSDADVGWHALCDAIYGALAAGDIGRHFPPSDPQWKGAASEVFLRHAAGLAREGGWRISHLDCTLICERPKIGPHAAAMIARTAEVTGVPREAVSVKATTSERLGFAGRGEGIAAMTTATLMRP
jgi:2-C-methyl-D-erythritol 4-phosphate cytidylyltransferase/2-C-methyl-D-erythritol 2,4-cyclodiphosphate synthase